MFSRNSEKGCFDLPRVRTRACGKYSADKIQETPEKAVMFAPDYNRAMTNEQRHLPLTDIDRPRISLRPVRRNSPEYAEMVESIAKDGVLQPILVRPKDERYEIVEGWHRYEAAKEAGLVSIPCLIREMSDEEVLIFQLKCNAIRPKTHSFEYARRLKMLMESGLTLPELCARIDKTPKWVRDQLQLNRICEEARPAFERGEIPVTSALALANLPGDLQEKFVDDAIAMTAKEFVSRAKAAKRDFQAYLMRLRQEDWDNGASTPKPRAINVLKREALKPKAWKDVCQAAKCKTPRDGWVACMSWVLMLDPVTVENRKAGRQEKQKDEDVRATRDEWRKLNRDLIRKFVLNNQKSET